MSIALERGGGIGRPAFPRVIPRFRPHRPPPEAAPPPAPAAVEEWEPCSSSSIGRAAEGSDGEDSAGEVQSALKGPLDTMDLLEETLPFRRSISKFYCGKSKSFAGMTDALPSSSPSSAKDLRKSANSDTRKRKSLFPFRKLWERSRPNSQRSDGCSIAKRPANADRTTVASSKSSSGSNSSSSGSSSEDYQCQSQLQTQSGKGTRVKRISLPMRSCSLMDLEGVECGELELHVQRRG